MFKNTTKFCSSSSLCFKVLSIILKCLISVSNSFCNNSISLCSSLICNSYVYRFSLIENAMSYNCVSQPTGQIFSSNGMYSASESTVSSVSSELVSDDCVIESKEPTNYNYEN